MRYSGENYTETGDIGIVNVINEPATTSTLFDKRVVRSYVADQDGSDDVVITVEIQDASGVKTARQLDLVSLVGTTGITTVTIEAFASAISLGSQVVTVASPVQQTYANAAFDVVADEVQISFDVGDLNEFSIGYLYVGPLSTVIDIQTEALNYSIESANPVNITRAGTAITSDTYLTTLVEFTANELPFSIIRSHVSTWAGEGFATPRIWYFPESCIMTGEVVYGIIDSDTIQLDPTWDAPEAKANATIGIRETQ